MQINQLELSISLYREANNSLIASESFQKQFSHSDFEVTIMIDETIRRIEQQIQSSESLTDERRKELVQLLSELKGEISDLEKTHNEDARSIASFTESSVREATRKEPNPDLVTHSLDGMMISVRRFEVSHPTLVNLINNIGQTLARIGI